MNHLRQAWHSRIEKSAYNGPIGGISLQELWDNSNAFLSVYVEVQKKSWGRTAELLGRKKVPFGAQFATFVEQTTREVLADKYRVEYVERLGIQRVCLVAEGDGVGANTYVLAETDRLGGKWGFPKKGLELEYRTADPFPRFLQTLLYGTNEEVARVWAEQIADVPYDDAQFDLLEGKPHVIAYRGISLPPGVDPATSNKDGGGTGISWTLEEDVAKAIAQRGGAGFIRENNPSDATFVRMNEEKQYVPTVLRAEVVLGRAKPYRPWNFGYMSEMELDIPRGTEVLVNGWKQAKPVPLSQAQVNEAQKQWARYRELQRKYPKWDFPDAATNDEFFEAKAAGYYARWEWGPWHTGQWRRTAASHPMLPPGWDYSTGGDAVPGGYNGYIVIYTDTGERAGYLDYQTGGDEPPLIAMVEVDPKFRGQGVATLLYQLAKQELEVSELDPGMMTPEGVAWWNKVKNL